MATLPAHENLVRYYGSWTEDGSVARLRDEIGELRRRSGSAPSAGGAVSDDEDAGSEWESSLESLRSSESGDIRSDVSRAPQDVRGGLAPSLPLALAGGGTLCLQMELCTTPTLQAVLQQEMQHRLNYTCADLSEPAAETEAEAATRPPLVPPRVRWMWVAGLSRGLHAVHTAGW